MFSSNRFYKTFFFASKEILQFLLQDWSFYYQWLFLICNKTLKLNNVTQKTTKKKFFSIGYCSLFLSLLHTHTLSNTHSVINIYLNDEYTYRHTQTKTYKYTHTHTNAHKNTHTYTFTHTLQTQNIFLPSLMSIYSNEPCKLSNVEYRHIQLSQQSKWMNDQNRLSLFFVDCRFLLISNFAW